MRNQIYGIFIILLVCLTSCYENVDNTVNETTTEEQPNIIINTAIVGKVLLNVDNNPDVTEEELLSSNYSLVVNGEYFDVNAKYFSIKVKQVEKTGQSIFVYENDEPVAFAHTMLIENDFNYLDIKHFPEWNSVTYDDSKTTYSIDNLGSLNTKDAFTTDQSDHQTLLEFVSGKVEDAAIIKQLGYHGFNENNILLTMEGLDAFYLSFEDEEKQQLNFSNNGAILNLEKSYPNNTALFYFDEVKDQWIKQQELSESTDLKIFENGYYMIAKHNIATIVEGSFVYDESPIAYQEYQIINDQYRIAGISTAKGRWISVTPSMMEFDLNLFSPCEDILYTTDLGVEEIYDVQDITMDPDQYLFYNIETTILDCNGMPSSNGAIVITDQEELGHVLLFEEGEIDAVVSVCNNQFDVSTYDLDRDLEGESISWDLGNGQDLDYLLECNTLEGYSYIQLTRDGKQESKVYESFNVETIGDQTILSSPNGEFKFLFKGLQAGVYPNDQINIAINDPSFGDFGYEMSCENSTQGCGIKECFVSHYDIDDAGIIRLTFAGTLWMSTIEPRLAGEFPVEGIIIVM